MHLAVLKKEIIEHLNLQPNDNFIDCTAGEGGHLFSLLEKTQPDGLALGIDKDKRNVELIKEKANQRVIVREDNYLNLEKIAKEENLKNISAILFDLGFSSWHIDESGRGFSFQKEELLDMRYSLKDETMAWEIINSWPPEEIEIIIKELGEDRFARKITKAIILRRKEKKITTAKELAELIVKEVPRTKKIHPATKTFQALRLVVNRELENLEKALPLALKILKKEGRLSVISYHSLEDRIVKRFFKQMNQEKKVEILNKKPIIPGQGEIKNNPRARSAKLRTIIKKE